MARYGRVLDQRPRDDGDGWSLLGGFDMPVMIEFPIGAGEVPRLDAVLVTHSDNDHYSVPTCRDLAAMVGEFHSTKYVASLTEKEGLPGFGHDIGDPFAIEAHPRPSPADADGRCHAVRLAPTANGTSGSTVRSTWPTRTRKRRCCSTTGQCRCLGLPTIQRRPCIISGPDREPGTHPCAGPRRALRAAASLTFTPRSCGRPAPAE
jgi:hypothetical protein